MLRVLPSYFQHLQKYPDTTIAKTFGIFEVNIDQFESICVMIMQNTLPAVDNYDLHYVFDMKGSQINREVLKSIPTRAMRDMKHTGGQVLKDLDYIRLKEVKRYFKMKESDIEEIIQSLNLDVEFLRSCRFMDYSILFAIRKAKYTECK